MILSSKFVTVIDDNTLEVFIYSPNDIQTEKTPYEYNEIVYHLIIDWQNEQNICLILFIIESDIKYVTLIMVHKIFLSN